ncbi:MAG TPA: BON domain-containing protein [Anaerolineales bacterium]|nr:BON domain-containing protein [Anaerolineales bacterium]
MNTMQDLQHQVQDALMGDDRLHDLHDHGIEVLDNNGVITLRGVVHSIEARERAEAVAREVEGVTSVINEIDVV